MRVEKAKQRLELEDCCDLKRESLHLHHKTPNLAMKAFLQRKKRNIDTVHTNEKMTKVRFN